MARLLTIKLYIPILTLGGNCKRGFKIQLTSNLDKIQTELDVFCGCHVQYDIQKGVVYPHNLSLPPKSTCGWSSLHLGGECVILYLPLTKKSPHQMLIGAA